MTTLELVREPALTAAAASYLGHKRKRLTPKTERGYRAVLREFAVCYPAREITDFEPPHGTILIEDFLNGRYGHLQPRTYNKAFSVIHDFMVWHVNREMLRRDPMAQLEKATPRAFHRTTFSDEERARIIGSNPDLHDQVALRLLLDYGIRKGTLRNVRFEHFDWQTRRLTIFTKGEKIFQIPIVDDRVWQLLDQLDEPGSHYLLAHQLLRRRRPPEKKQFMVAASLIQELQQVLEQITDSHCVREVQTVTVGLAHVEHWRGLAEAAASSQVRCFPTEQAGDHQLHDWWYRCLVRAEIVAPGTTSGRRMHGARYTAGQRVLDKTGNLKAAQALLCHATIGTTGDIYVGWGVEQLAETMRGVVGTDTGDLTAALHAQIRKLK